MDYSLLINVLLKNIYVISFSMTSMWLISIIKKDASIVDIFWGLGFVFIAWTSFIAGYGDFPRKVVISLLASLWGIRLTLYILIRNWSKGEDYRYQAMRKKHGKTFWLKSFYTVFMFQGLMMFIVSLPLQIGQTYSGTGYLTATDITGTAIWITGFFFETVSDYQMYTFKNNEANKGLVMNKGLWQYSRHPNYFGEVIMWWGIFIIAAPVPYGWISVISPLLITFLLLKVSGVVMLEKSLIETKPKYKDYVKNTNAFIPWFPKKQ